MGRLVPAIAFGFVISATRSKAESGSVEVYYLIAIAVLSTVFGFIHWIVTRWKIEGDTLRIETGLIRRDSRRLPLNRIQAVDVVRPLAARLLGVSELRIRLAGSGSTDGRLAYLSEEGATALRSRLLNGSPETEAGAPALAEVPMAVVPTGRLVGSVLLSLVSIVLIGTVLTLVVLDDIAPRAATAAAGALAVYLLSFAGVVWRRLAGQFHLGVALLKGRHAAIGMTLFS
jgi:putative membrane protein